MKKVLLAAAVLCVSAFAHFEVLFTPTTEIESGDARISSFFTHPFEGSPLMTRGTDKSGSAQGNGIKEVFSVLEGNKTDLTSAVRDVVWTAQGTSAGGIEINMTGANFRSMGDYAVVVIPHPYWEESENLYIQQVAKILLSKGDSKDNWQDRMLEGYTEIIPLINPHNVTKGQIFRARVVDSEGNPAAGVTVEASVLNHAVNQARSVTGAGRPRTANEKQGTNTVITDDNGIFAFVPLVSGFWGFAALSASGVTEYNGEELELSPVIWINVAD